jgi:hypothetical protein
VNLSSFNTTLPSSSAVRVSQPPASAAPTATATASADKQKPKKAKPAAAAETKQVI